MGNRGSLRSRIRRAGFLNCLLTHAHSEHAQENEDHADPEGQAEPREPLGDPLVDGKLLRLRLFGDPLLSIRLIGLTLNLVVERDKGLPFPALELLGSESGRPPTLLGVREAF